MPHGRYAPSPTGGLHLGNARTALVAWARARADGARFVMRVEDLDAQRTVPEAVDGNLRELRWLGLDWDEGPDVGGPHAPYRQSERHDRYRAALDRLERSDRTFACYLSRRDLRELSSAPHGAGRVYGARERATNARLAERKRQAGKMPAVRLRMPEGVETIDDLLAGRREVDPARAIGDVVLRRADGAWAYQLAVVVDDAAMGVAEVVRGDDLLVQSAGQNALHRLLGHRPPSYLHVPLLHGPDGRRLAKRDGPATLAALQAEGVPAERVVGLLSWTLGQSDRPRPLSAPAFLERFDPHRIPRHPIALSAAADDVLRGGSGPAGPPLPPPGHDPDGPVHSP